MKALLSKEHYCYKQNPYIISGAHCLLLPPPFYRKPHTYKKILIPPSMIFQDCQLPLIYRGFMLFSKTAQYCRIFQMLPRF